MKSLNKYAFSFVGGFLSTLFFHQLLVALMHSMGLIPFAAFNMAPTEPFGVPTVISLAFWGGVWGAVIWAVVFNSSTLKQLLLCVVFGAVGPTLVAYYLILPMKGITMPTSFIAIGFILNGAWGLGLWLFMKLSRQ